MHHSALSRRSVFKLIAAASAAGVLSKEASAEPPLPLTRHVKNVLSDPDFLNPVIPWDKPLVESELAVLAVLVDLLLPGDEQSPSPSAIGVPDFLNEWVGAPYQTNIEDLEILRGGLAWLNTHCHQKHGKTFVALPAAAQIAILDSICNPAATPPELAYGSRFFRKLRMLTLGGYYTHSSTWKSLGYVGNVPIAGPYPGVPDEIIVLLGLQDVV